KLQRGTSYPAIRDSDMREQIIPLPPTNEQRRIVEAIEAQFTRLDAGVAALKRLQANLKRYKAAVLKAACEGKLVPQDPNDEPAADLLARILTERRAQWETDQRAKGKDPRKLTYPEPAAPDTSDLPDLPEGWAVASMDELTSRITSGSRDWSQYYDRGTGTFIMAQNIRLGRLDLAFRQAVDPPQDDTSRERSQVEAGDLLVTIVGANTGDVCLVTEELPDHYVCQSVSLMRPVDMDISAYLSLYMISQENGQKQYQRYIYGAGRPHLSFDQLKMTAIMLPPIDEQQTIVIEAERLLSLIEAIEIIAIQNVARAERLRQSILKEAFAGRLVAQDPHDEPATALLERIQQQRAPRKGQF
ncbi:MAG: restriction endonuclease subunit S, partial [Chloroflexota bacterium]